MFACVSLTQNKISCVADEIREKLLITEIWYGGPGPRFTYHSLCAEYAPAVLGVEWCPFELLVTVLLAVEPANFAESVQTALGLSATAASRSAAAPSSS